MENRSGHQKITDDHIIDRPLTVREAFRIQDNLKLKILFLTENGILKGVVSDGDIRRYILNGGKLDQDVMLMATRMPVTARTWEDAILIMEKRPNLKAVPILDENGRISDIYSESILCKRFIDIPVVINAGGRGTRLEPYTSILPKPLIPIGNLPVIELIMKEFEGFACNEFSVIVNYRKQMIKAYFCENEAKHNIQWYEENSPLGTGGGLSLLRGKVGRAFFFSNCDTLIKTDYACIYDQHRKEKNDITIVSAYKSLKLPYGVIESGNHGRVEAIKEKPEISFLTNTGLYLLEPDVFEFMQDNEKVDFPVIIEKMRKAGKRVGVYPVSENEWMDMGQLDELKRMRSLLSEEGVVE